MGAPCTLVLFTSSYPYDIAFEQTFLETEIEYLSLNFDQIIIVPEVVGGKKSRTPTNVEVEECYASIIKSNIRKSIKIFFTALFSRIFYKDILYRPIILFKPVALLRLILFAGQAEYTCRWVCDLLQRRGIDTTHCIFYTYWWNQSSMGIGLVKKIYPQIKLVSRAHRGDLYAEQYNAAYIPCQEQSLKFFDCLLPDSENGTKYITSRYPWAKSLCETARLGVKDPGFITSYSMDDIFRIVSCSFIIPRKRVDLLLKGISYAAKLRPYQQFKWYHIGDGPLRRAIEDMAYRKLPVNVKFDIMGHLPPEQLMLFYKNKPIDVFMNVSESEGTPVSIMEAISCGIPIIATVAGGNPEIVSEQNGKLLNLNPTPDEIAAAIFSIMDNPELTIMKRSESRRVWQEMYDADNNFKSFATLARSLII